MLEDYGRWMAALILLTLLLAAVFLFATADLDMYENTLTDVRSAPVLSGEGTRLKQMTGRRSSL